MEDVSRLLRSFGGMCGRPRREKSREYNLSLYIHGAGADELARLEAALGSVCPGEAPAEAPSQPPGETPKPAAASTGPAQASGSLDEIFGFSGGAPKNGAPSNPAPAPAPAAPPAAASDLASLLGSPAPKAEEPKAPDPVPAPAAPEPAAPPVTPNAIPNGRQDGGATAPPPPPIAAAPSRALDSLPLYGARLEPDPTKDFEGLLVGAHNRFAHAGALSIASNPGGLYNPWFVSGGIGSGKSHLLHALARKLGESGQVFLTTGPRLVVAVNRLQRAGRIRELEEAAAKAQSLVLDDFHLTGLSEENREAIAALFQGFLKEGRQMVLASAYPARLMGAFEEALGLRLASGQAVELRLPSGEDLKELLQASLRGAGFSAQETNEADWWSRAGDVFAPASVGVRRLRRLKALSGRLGKPASLRDLLAELAASSAGAIPEDDAVKAAGGEPDPGDGEPTALFFPSGEEARADWTWVRLRRAARERGWPFSWKRTARMAYDPGEAYGVPCWIAEQCQRAAPRAALVLAPASGGLAEGGEDVRAALEGLTEGLGVRTSFVPHTAAASPAVYVRAYLDMLPEAA